MDNYNFLADLMDAFQSSPDWIKAVWVAAVPGFLLGTLALILRYRLEIRRLAADAESRETTREREEHLRFMFREELALALALQGANYAPALSLPPPESSQQ